MKFCSHCGAAAIVLRIPDGDTLPRFVCGACGTELPGGASGLL